MAGVLLAALPPPPGGATPIPRTPTPVVPLPTATTAALAEHSNQLNTGQVILIVVLVLGTIVLIALGLKPLVVHRGTQDEADPSNAAAVPERERPPAEGVAPPSPAPDPEADREATRGGVPRPTIPSPPRDATAEPGGAAPPVPEIAETVAPPPERTQPAPGARDVSIDAIAGITETVRELLEAANAGEVVRGFAFYSDDYYRRFREESGRSDDELAAAFAAASPAPPEARSDLGAVLDVRALPDGRVQATVVYAQPPATPPERFTFVWSLERHRWLIDDIAAVEDEAGAP